MAAPDRASHLFLSPEWVHEVTRVVQHARQIDERFGDLATGFSMNLAYLIDGLPHELRDRYGGGTQAVIFVQLDQGTVRKIQIGPEFPDEQVDFTVASDYRVARQIFQGELNPASSFINQQLKIQPLERIYQRPRFTAKSIITANLILKFARQVPTVFVSGP